MFHYKDYSELYIGSSNISRSALTSGIEWNYRFSNKTDPINYEKFYNTFVDLFENHSIVIDDEELKNIQRTGTVRQYQMTWTDTICRMIKRHQSDTAI